MSNFNKIITNVLKSEGGYAYVQGDAGGETYRGISRRHNPNWAGWRIVDAHKPLRNNETINDTNLENLVLTFYKQNYWDKIMLDSVKADSLQEIIFDAYVNSGANGIVVLQRSLNKCGASLSVDGQCGAKTVAAINAANPKTLFDTYKADRAEYYKTIAARGENAKFLKGWLARLEGIDYRAMVYISTGVIVLGVASFF